jgi:transcriptional regulator with XRE-family HTH domain
VQHPSRVQNQFANQKKLLALNVRGLRQGRGLSQEAMALEAEIDRTYASQIERGVGNPSLKVICALAEVLKVHPNTLFTPKA